MADKGNPSHLEHVKESSNFLRGTIAQELVNGEAVFNEDNCNLLKVHGTYQQDDRDVRSEGKHFIFMVRSRVPGGKSPPLQFLGELDLCDKFANGIARVTDRQGSSFTAS